MIYKDFKEEIKNVCIVKEILLTDLSVSNRSNERKKRKVHDHLIKGK